MTARSLLSARDRSFTPARSAARMAGRSRYGRGAPMPWHAYRQSGGHTEAESDTARTCRVGAHSPAAHPVALRPAGLLKT